MTQNEFILYLRDQLRLGNWFITTELLPEGQWDSPAYTTIDREQQRATLHLSTEATREQVAHEMMHVALADLIFLASNNRPIGDMEAIHLIEERLCNTLGHILWNLADDAEG